MCRKVLKFCEENYPVQILKAVAYSIKRSKYLLTSTLF